MSFPELKPKVVLCVAAHPDDIDYLAGGSVALWAQSGAKVYLYVLTDGGRGSDDPDMTPKQLSELRESEQRAAAKILGITDVFFGHFPDGELENSHDVKRGIVRLIRTYKPDVVVGWDPEFWNSPTHGFLNHPDHQAAGQATHHSVYPYARNLASYRELFDDEGLEPHSVTTLLLLTLADNYNYSIDVTAVMDTKLEAMRAHTSQRGSGDEAMVTGWAREIGARLSGESANDQPVYAEAFIRCDIHI